MTGGLIKETSVNMKGVKVKMTRLKLLNSLTKYCGPTSSVTIVKHRHLVLDLVLRREKPLSRQVCFLFMHTCSALESSVSEESCG